LQRGPLVYCLEDADNPVAPHRVALPPHTPLVARREDASLGDIVVIGAQACASDEEGWDGVLYRTTPPSPKPFDLTAIPYYAWDNRNGGRMRVWLREAAMEAATTRPEDSGG